MLNPIEDIRKTSRDFLLINRRMQRDKLNDNQRKCEDQSTSEDSVLEFANKLKTKTSVTANELRILKNALFDDVKYIETFLGVHGALRGLIREFTGLDTAKQCEAAACFCNLALGDSRATHVLAKSLGTYLVTSLDSLSIELAITSAWTIGNLARSGERTCDILVAQGALSKLTEILHNSKIEDMLNATIYALEHFHYNMKDNFSHDHIQKMLQAIRHIPKNVNTSKLLFFLSCHSEFTNSEYFDDGFLDFLIETYINELESIIVHKDQNEYNFLYITRSLANMCVSSVICDKVLSQLVEKCSKNICSVCESNIDDIRSSSIWFLGNLFNYSSNSLKQRFFKSV